jgi:hypothetical protein
MEDTDDGGEELCLRFSAPTFFAAVDLLSLFAMAVRRRPTPTLPLNSWILLSSPTTSLFQPPRAVRSWTHPRTASSSLAWTPPTTTHAATPPRRLGSKSPATGEQSVLIFHPRRSPNPRPDSGRSKVSTSSVCAASSKF